MQRTLTLAFAMVLITGAPAIAASHGQGPTASATSADQKPCGKAPRRGCSGKGINSLQFGVGRGVKAPTHGVSVARKAP